MNVVTDFYKLRPDEVDSINGAFYWNDRIEALPEGQEGLSDAARGFDYADYAEAWDAVESATEAAALKAQINTVTGVVFIGTDANSDRIRK